MSGRDRISELPESLLTQILSYLPTEQSVQTSVLSKRWENLWLSVSVLDLNCSVFPYDADELLLSFIDKLLEFSPELSLLKARVKCKSTVIDGFRDRLATVIDRGTQHLDVVSSTDYYEDAFGVTLPVVDFMPMNLYTSRTLVYLKLSSSGLRDPAFVFMPCLRFLHLEEVKWLVHLEKLVSGCPVLEELTLVRDLDDEYSRWHDEFMVMRVRSQSLKKFRVPLKHRWGCSSEVRCTLEIDAPGLEHMSLGEDQFDSIVVKNMSSLFMVELDIKFALDLYSKVGMIPKFNNLSRLEAVFPSDTLQFLPVFLECCPNLKHLVLKVVHSEEMEEGLDLTNVPRCVSSTLECVEIQDKFEWEEGKMKVASYFLENSAVLKKLILNPTAYNQNIYEKVNQLTKRSRGCQIIHE
ncbi:hypothetical protein Bca52824_079140 [Brassica carinata]|uniref:F-box domain-containing protein n=1 Tax=Brassica carinata TaxID=52824 RepID=A0A8X7U0F0_BRACI|nr:hypothetical protein Bca52824_079140 [Brassica carinata]